MPESKFKEKDTADDFASSLPEEVEEDEIIEEGDGDGDGGGGGGGGGQSATYPDHPGLNLTDGDEKRIKGPAPSGWGSFGGVVFAGLLGLPLGLAYSIGFGFIGGLVGNEIEYQVLGRFSSRAFTLKEYIEPNEVTDMLGILSSSRRRAIIIVLNSEGELARDDLVRKVMEFESMTSSDPESAQGKRLITSLVRTHLPQLMERGVIESQGSLMDEESSYELSQKGHLVFKMIEACSAFLDVPLRFQNYDVVFSLLKNFRRRCVIQLLHENGEMTVSDLTEEIGAREEEVQRKELTDETRKRVYVSLYQTHLPRLEESNAISYDRDTGSVELIEQGKRLVHLKEFIERYFVK